MNEAALVEGRKLKEGRRTRSGRWNLEGQQTRFALWLLLPALLMMGLFIAYPVVYSFLLTFSEFTVREQHWFKVGLTNYQRVFADPAFYKALRFTLAYTGAYVVLSVSLALLVGVLLQQIKIGESFFRSLLFLPTVVPVTMGYLMFQWILDPNYGILNHVLREGLELPALARNWLSDRETVFPSLVGVTLWGFGPWILILAGLLAIPKDYYEAARVDGASAWEEFWHISLPLLRNTLMVVLVFQLVYALKIFVPIYILTSGGPANETQSLYYLVFDKISQNKLAYATTVGWVFTLLTAVISIATSLVFRLRRD